jgi:hypothetical protein
VTVNNLAKMSDTNSGSNATGGAISSNTADIEGNLEDLLKQLHGQIRTSGWLEQNTANKLEEQNPELIKAWKEAIDEKKD